MHVIEKSRETVEQLLARRNLPKTYEEKCQYALDLVDMHLHEENEHPIPVSCGHRRHLRYGIGNVLINEESDDDDFWNKIVQQRELLRREIDSVKADPGDVVSRPIKGTMPAPTGSPRHSQRRWELSSSLPWPPMLQRRYR